jgi:hypothetical protein
LRGRYYPSWYVHALPYPSPAASSNLTSPPRKESLFAIHGIGGAIMPARSMQCTPSARPAHQPRNHGHYGTRYRATCRQATAYSCALSATLPPHGAPGLVPCFYYWPIRYSWAIQNAGMSTGVKAQMGPDFVFALPGVRLRVLGTPGCQGAGPARAAASYLKHS